MIYESKGLLCLLLAAVFLTATISAFAADFSDTNGHWTENALDRWAEYGVANGSGDGTFKPNNNLTRAEMAALLSKTFGWQETAANDFKNIARNEWYASDILKAKAAGIMLAAVNGMAQKGYVRGSDDGKFNPVRNINRAEAFAVIDQSVKNYIYKPGTYSVSGSGITVIAAAGVTLENSTVNGDLFIAAGAKTGETVLKNVTVSGSTYIQSGSGATVSLSGCHFQDVEIEGKGASVSFGGGDSGSSGGSRSSGDGVIDFGNLFK